MSDAQSDRRLSYVVEEYFNRRGTYPIVLTRRGAVPDDELEQFHADVRDAFENATGVAVLDSQVLAGEFWSGVLVELSGESYITVEDGEPAGEEMCLRVVRDLHRDFATTRQEETIGLSAGTSVYSSSALGSLGREFFEQS